MKESEALAQIAYLEAAFEHELPPATRELWVRELVVWDASDVAAVCRQAMLDGPHMPRIGQLLRELATSGVDVHEAWALVCEEISRVGMSGEPVFSDETITRTVELMGWSTLCMASDEYWSRKSFEGVYSSVRESRLRAAVSVPERRRPALNMEPRDAVEGSLEGAPWL